MAGQSETGDTAEVVSPERTKNALKSTLTTSQELEAISACLSDEYLQIRFGDVERFLVLEAASHHYSERSKYENPEETNKVSSNIWSRLAETSDIVENAVDIAPELANSDQGFFFSHDIYGFDEIGVDIDFSSGDINAYATLTGHIQRKEAANVLRDTIKDSFSLEEHADGVDSYTTDLHELHHRSTSRVPKLAAKLGISEDELIGIVFEDSEGLEEKYADNLDLLHEIQSHVRYDTSRFGQFIKEVTAYTTSDTFGAGTTEDKHATRLILGSPDAYEHAGKLLAENTPRQIAAIEMKVKQLIGAGFSAKEIDLRLREKFTRIYKK